MWTPRVNSFREFLVRTLSKDPFKTIGRHVGRQTRARRTGRPERRTGVEPTNDRRFGRHADVHANAVHVRARRTAGALHGRTVSRGSTARLLCWKF